jgi:ABC-type transport system substrate-binding protein
MKNNKLIFILFAIVFGIVFAVVLNSCKKREEQGKLPTLTVAIAPYQDLAMLVNAPELKFDAKAGITLNLVTMAWEDILPAVASAGKTVDVGFGSYVEYLTKFAKINEGSDDPVIYIQPLYVYKGGGVYRSFP